MNPAPPQTNSFMRASSHHQPSCTRHSGSGREISREPVLPRGHRQDVLALGLQRRPGGARRGARHLLARGGIDAAVDLGLAEYLAREAVPGDPARARQVDEAADLAFEQPDHGRREVPGPRGRADLILDDLHGVTLAGEAQHRGDEVGAGDPVEPGGAYLAVLSREAASTWRSPSASLVEP